MSRIGIIYTITMYEKTRSTSHKLIQKLSNDKNKTNISIFYIIN